MKSFLLNYHVDFFYDPHVSGIMKNLKMIWNYYLDFLKSNSKTKKKKITNATKEGCKLRKTIDVICSCDTEILKFSFLTSEI